MMLVSFDLVKGENLAASLGKFPHGATQCDTVDCATEPQIRGSDVAPERR